MEELLRILHQLKQVLNFPLFHFGENEFTAWGILLFFVLLLLLIWTSSRIKKWLIERLLSRTHLDVGGRHAIGTIASYALLVIGFVIILQTAGLDLSAFTILVGSLSIGIGLGLQTITNNFVSGLIILLERPVKLGDRVEFGNLNGDIVRISARATTILTNNNVAVIVPNSELITSPVINWSYPNRRVRFHVPVGVAYGSDPGQVKKILLDTANKHAGVLKEPSADVLLDQFGENSIDFMLRVWTLEYSDKPNVLKSDLYFSIIEQFKENGIEIPFPQRDLHIRNNPQLHLHGREGSEPPTQK
jgi:small-conductance mechanosensitive channel